MNILVHCFQISPTRGSEFAVSWNYVCQMSRHHHLYVLVGATVNNNLGDYSQLDDVSLPNVDFIFIDTGRIYKSVRFICDKIISRFLGRQFTKYIAYYFWNKRVFHVLNHDENLLSKIDLIHFLSPVGFHEIGYLYKLGKPCIWGPVGGFANCKKEFYKQWTMKSGRSIMFKNFYNTISIATSLHLRKAMKSYDVVIANTKEHLDFIQKRFSPKATLYLPEGSMRISVHEIKDKLHIVRKYDDVAYTEKIRCIWAGHLEDRKMPGMLLDILKLTRHRKKFKVIVIGGGYLEGYIRDRVFAEKLSDCVELCGSLPRVEVCRCFMTSHLHILTSSYEANTTVIFEAMEECVPTIVFDHFGMADLVKNKETGCKIPVGDYWTMCSSFATALDEIAENPTLLKEWALNLRDDSKYYTIESRMDFFERCYEDAVRAYAAGGAQ